MNKTDILLPCLWVMASAVFAQQGNPYGFRLETDTGAVELFIDAGDGTPDPNRRRLLNEEVVFNTTGKTTTLGNPPDTVGYVEVYVVGRTCAEFPLRMRPPECETCNSRTDNRLTRCDRGAFLWMRRSDFHAAPKFAVRSKRGFDLNVGLMTMPLTYRPRRGHLAPIFDGATNINSSIGLKKRLSERFDHYFLFFGAFGIQSITMNSSNNPSIEDPEKVEGEFGIVLAGGFILEFDKVQFGIMLGTDQATGERAKDYVYQGAPWVGLTLGTSIHTGDIKRGKAASR